MCSEYLKFLHMTKLKQRILKFQFWIKKMYLLFVPPAQIPETMFGELKIGTLSVWSRAAFEEWSDLIKEVSKLGSELL